MEALVDAHIIAPLQLDPLNYSVNMGAIHTAIRETSIQFLRGITVAPRESRPFAVTLIRAGGKCAQAISC